jgi:hypothetical protein
MRTERSRRFGHREIERLLAGVPGADRTSLRTLLNLAAGPPTPAEAAGLREAVQGFREAYRVPAPASASTRSGRGVVAQATRALAVKGAAALGVLLLGGVAFAASTGMLPDSVQRRAHDLVAPLGISLPHPPVAPGTRPLAHGQTAAASTPAAAGLCRAWQVETEANHGTASDTPARRALALLAGGPEHIDTFCAQVLGATPIPGSSPGTGPTAGGGSSHGSGTPGHPSPTPHPTSHG